VIELRPERLAVYSFAYIPRLRPHQKRIHPATLPDQATKFDLLAGLVTALTGAGYLHIGMDHFALAEDELAAAAGSGTLTRNFMGYTTRRGTDVVAVGTSGISDIAGAYVQNHRRLASYQADVDADELPIERGVVLSDDDRTRRHVITELMCQGRVDLEDVGERLGIEVESYFASELAALGEPGGLVDEGLATVDGAVVAATQLGQLFIRRLAMVFDTYLERNSHEHPDSSRVI
jgi:oxygen-independent coproporphyrinogen-3 oxidase